MYLCYIDESGTSDIPGNTSHFVLSGISIPIERWKDCDREIQNIKQKFSLMDTEIHVGWILRPYLEQTRIPDFDTLPHAQRISEISTLRKTELLRLQKAKKPKHYVQTKKNYKKTEPYIHLTYQERQAFIKEIAQLVSGWEFSRLFAECIDKIFFDPTRTKQSVDEQSFEQVVSRFEKFLQNANKNNSNPDYGLLIHDHNPTVSTKHTELMRKFHQRGTLWTTLKHIIETPLFVDSKLTSMVQVADLCSYALRRYLENREEELFNLIFSRADQKDGVVVSVRHFTIPGCACKICTSRRKKP